MAGLFSKLKVHLATLLILSTQFVVTPAYSHELQENRAALVLRNDRLISATLYLNLIEVLKKTSAPMGDPIELTAKLAAMSDAEFAKQFNMMKKMIQSGIVLKTVAGKPLKLGNWQWPEVGEVQKQSREITMRVVLSPSDHFHETPLEVRFQIQSEEPFSSVRVELPEALRPITLIATRPKQVRLSVGTTGLVVDF